MQIPFHHKKNVEKVLDYIWESKIDGIFCVGDEIDVAELGLFNKGTRKEFEGTLQKNFDLTHRILGEFREALGSKKKPFVLQRSNHSQRIEMNIGGSCGISSINIVISINQLPKSPTIL